MVKFKAMNPNLINDDFLQCPYCSGALTGTKGDLFCTQCTKQYATQGTYIDFVDLSRSDNVARKAIVTWGQNLHNFSLSDEGHCGHFTQFTDVFDDFFHFTEHSRIVDIGCGAGEDAVKLAHSRPDLEVFAFDIGQNIISLANKSLSLENLHFMRADSRFLPFRNEVFDYVVSFGVFHHTDSPKKCVLEAFRVLKEGGTAFVYLYKNHEDNFVKRIGVIGEAFIMKKLSGMPYRNAKTLSHALAIPCLLLFSWPAWLMKKIPRLSRFAKTLPMHWGTTPASIHCDLEDRLLAPINHRFSRLAFKQLFEETGFIETSIVTRSGGHYAMAKK